VVRKLRELLPRVEHGDLHDMLQAMLEAHIANIAAANDALATVQAR
jgi:hypothetical protein